MTHEAEFVLFTVSANMVEQPFPCSYMSVFGYFQFSV